MKKTLMTAILSTAMATAGGNIMEPQTEAIDYDYNPCSTATTMNVSDGETGTLDCVSRFYAGIGVGLREVRDLKEPLGGLKVGYSVNEHIALEVAGYYSDISKTVDVMVVANTSSLYGISLNAGVGYHYTIISDNQALFVGSTTDTEYSGLTGKLGAEYKLNNTLGLYADLIHNYNQNNAKLSDTYGIVGIRIRF